MTPLRVPSAAGFTAGSMPMKGRLNSLRRVEIAAAVAVLQAMTMACAPLEIIRRVISRQRERMNSGSFSP